MRALTIAVLLVMILVSAWVGIRGIDLLRPVPANMGSMRAYCDTGRGIFLPCASIELDNVET